MSGVATLDLEASLVPIVGPGNVSTAPDRLAPLLKDARGYTGGASAVVWPATAAEVGQILSFCGEHGIAVTPQGGNTGLVGGGIPGPDPRTAILLSLSRMNRIRDIDADNFTITADAGCTVAQVQAAAMDRDRLFPLSFGAEGSAQVGGALSTNAGGIRAIRYGVARNLVLGLEVVLPSGALISDLSKVRKNNTGYDLKHLFLGAEGTLGVITGATLALAPRLRQVETVFAAVPSVEAAIALLTHARSVASDLVAFELIPDVVLETVLALVPGTVRPLAAPSRWYVLFEFGTPIAGLPLRDLVLGGLEAAFDRGLVTNATIAESEQQRRGLWRLRECVGEALSRLDRNILSLDVSVPISAIPRFVAEADAYVAARAAEAETAAVGHVGDGNVHYEVIVPRTQEGWDDLKAILQAELEGLAVELGGSFSAEHGIGQIKREAMHRLKDPIAVATMAAIRGVLDPRSILNPGKVL